MDNSALLRFRRGSTANKSGSLTYGEPYVNTSLNTLQIGGLSSDLTLPAMNIVNAGDIEFTGNLTIGGTLIAKDIHIQHISSSIMYESGSTKFGDSLDDNHEFTGSVNVTGSQTIDGDLTILGNLFGGTTDPAFSASVSDRLTDAEITGSDHESRIDTLETSVPSNTARIVDLEISESFLHDTLGLKDLTAAEVAQLQNIDDETISNTQWGYLGTLDQSLSSSANVTFNELTGSNVRVSNDLFVGGNIFASSFIINHVTSSIIYDSGSTKFGDSQDDTHEFTGSVNISGSLTISSGLTVQSLSGSFSGSFEGDGSGLTGVTSIDTLQTVTDRGATTTNSITIGSLVDFAGHRSIRIDGSSGSISNFVELVTHETSPYLNADGDTFRILFNGDQVLSISSSNQLLLESGSSTIPSLAFENDPDTGFYSLIDNYIGISLGGINEYQFNPVAFQPLNDITLNLGTSNSRFNSIYVQSLLTGQGNGNQLFMKAYDFDGAFFKTFATLTAGNVPTAIWSGSFSGSYVGDGSGLTGVGGGSHNLGDHSDVNTSGSATGDLLFKSGSEWIDTSGSFTWDQINYNLLLGKDITYSGSANSASFSILQGENNHIIGSGTGTFNWGVFTGDINTFDNAGTTRHMNNSLFLGSNNTARIANGSFGIFGSILWGADNLIEPGQSGNYRQTFIGGNLNISRNSFQHVTGQYVDSAGLGAFSHGLGTSTYKLLTRGAWSVNLSENTAAQITGSGANADNSGIYSGIDHHIPSGSPRSAIIGGSGIRADDLTPDTVYVPNLKVSGSLNVTAGATGSFSGSFYGDGSGLTNVPGAGGSGLWITGSGGDIYYNAGDVGIGTSDPVAKLHVLGIISGSSDLQIDGNVIATELSGSHSGSFEGDGSGLTGIVSASYAVSTSYANNVDSFETLQSVTDNGSSTTNDISITGSLEVTENLIVYPTKPLYLDGGVDTYLNESSNGTISIVTNGTSRLIINSVGLSLAETSSPKILNQSTDITTPTIIPYGTDVNTGIGGSSGIITFITNGTGSITIDATQSVSMSADLLVSNAVTATSFSGSFSGSFEGDGSGLTGISGGSGLWTGSSGTITRESNVEITGSLLFGGSSTNALIGSGSTLRWNRISGQLSVFEVGLVSEYNRMGWQLGSNYAYLSTQDGEYLRYTIGTNTLELKTGGATRLTITDNGISGSVPFSGSFVGDGSGLTGIVSASYVPSFETFQSVTDNGNTTTNDITANQLTVQNGSTRGVYLNSTTEQIYATTSNNIVFRANGVASWNATQTVFGGIVGGSAHVLNEASTATNPTFAPHGLANDTGMGGTQGTISLITGGTEAVRVDASQNVTMSADLVVVGNIYANEFHTQFVSSSIIFSSGSTKFGDSWDDTHDFTGSVNITGSLTVVGPTIATSVSSSFSGSFEGDGSNLTGFVTGLWTGSNGTITRDSDVEITGSLNLTGSINGNIGFNNSDVEAWGAQLNVIEGTGSAFVIGGSSNELYGITNAYWDGANWKYKTTDVASTWGSWSTAAFDVRVVQSGTIDTNITWTQALRINHDGNIGFGTTDIESWASNYRAIEGSNSSILFDYSANNGLIDIINNAYWDGSWKFKTADSASLIQLAGGSIVFNVSNELGAEDGAISWVTGLSINNNSNATFNNEVSASVFSGSYVGDGSGLTGLSGISDAGIFKPTGSYYSTTNNLQVTGSFDTTGSLNVDGPLTATSKSFLINHPLILGKKLQYGSLEGPEYGVYHRGKLDDTDEIRLPDYWRNLVDIDSITVQITSRQKWQTHYVKDVKIDKIKIGKIGFGKIKAFYIVIAERKDISRLKVEL